MSAARSGKGTPGFWPALLRWGTAALVIATAHGGLAWLALSWRPNEAAAGAPEPAIMIELAAVSIAPEAPAEDLPPAPQPTEIEPPPLPEPPEPVVEPDPPPEPEIEPEPVQVPEPEIKLPELPQLPDPAAVLAPPPPPPKRVERKPPPPKQRVVERKVERERPRAKQATAPRPSTAPAAAPSAAPAGAAARPSVSTASWRGMLIAHLNRYKRFPGGARPGTVQVAFSIDRSGRVISARLAGSSGDPVLDQEAVSMIRRASPVPAPPDGLGRGAISLAVPVRYNR